MQELIKWVFLGLHPPDMPTGKEATDEMRCRYIKYNHRWKHAICYVVWALMVCGTAFFFWSRGDLPYIGTGFAYASDVEVKAKDLNEKIEAQTQALNNVVDGLNALVVRQVRSDLRETRRLQCIARDKLNYELVSKYGEDIDELKAQYYELVKREWSTPRCEDT